MRNSRAHRRMATCAGDKRNAMHSLWPHPCHTHNKTPHRARSAHSHTTRRRTTLRCTNARHLTHTAQHPYSHPSPHTLTVHLRPCSPRRRALCRADHCAQRLRNAAFDVLQLPRPRRSPATGSSVFSRWRPRWVPLPQRGNLKLGAPRTGGSRREPALTCNGDKEHSHRTHDGRAAGGRACRRVL